MPTPQLSIRYLLADEQNVSGHYACVQHEEADPMDRPEFMASLPFHFSDDVLAITADQLGLLHENNQNFLLERGLIEEYEQLAELLRGLLLINQFATSGPAAGISCDPPAF